MLRAYGVTDKGRVRPSNEDCFGVDLGLRLCVVADGMGGHNAGEVAASMAVESVMATIRTGAIESAWPFAQDPNVSATGNLLAGAIHVANRQIYDLAVATPDYSGMGTTIVAVVERGGLLSIAHAGDSRIYLHDRSGLRQLTEDDSWIAAVLSKDPNMDPQTLKAHPMRHALTNVVGSRPSMTVNLQEMPLVGGERLILTSDGVHGAVELPQFRQIMAKGGELQSVATTLMNAALENGSRDNVTVVIADYQADRA
jgi:PPM family protein phosphatase